jgi:hypothetical protein
VVEDADSLRPEPEAARAVPDIPKEDISEPFRLPRRKGALPPWRPPSSKAVRGLGKPRQVVGLLMAPDGLLHAIYGMLTTRTTFIAATFHAVA